MKKYVNRKLPDYYPTMYLDGYTPDEIRIARHNTMLKRFEESEAENEAISDIKVESEIKFK